MNNSFYKMKGEKMNVHDQIDYYVTWALNSQT